MTPITFCITTAKNEKPYIELLLQSLQEHTEIQAHEILIFVDSDNQGTYEFLLEKKKELPNLKVSKNETGFRLGMQRGISVLMHNVTNEIVCYLQSDMVVGKDFDRHIIESLTDKNIVLCCARIEPPLHPASPEKIIKDFGVTPSSFNYRAFNEFVEELQAQKRPNQFGHFAPFALYKSTWDDVLGGFDTQFRVSREDSDFIIRLELNGLQAVQSWNACVYHFTCVSSRGKDWYAPTDKEVEYTNNLQGIADQQELRRFIRKWGYFGHSPKPVFDTALFIELDKAVDFSLLLTIEPFFKHIYVTDESVANQLIERAEFESFYYANLRWGYTFEHWENIKYLFNPVKFCEHIRYTPTVDGVDHDVVVSCKYSDLLTKITEENKFVIENVNELVDQNEIGAFECDPFTVNILNKRNLNGAYKRITSNRAEWEKYTFT